MTRSDECHVTSDEQARKNSEGQRTGAPGAGGGSSLVTRHSSLVLASSNPGKLREFREAGELRNVTVLPHPGFANLPMCIEDGDTFEANARKKAIHYSQEFSELVFADDSGICVDALGGAPGIYSARFAGPEATDRQNNERLLAELHRLETSGTVDRAAHYVCAIALALQGQVLAVVEGRVDGLIIDEPKGAGGFGYDPYFFYPPLGKTLAEIDPAEKFAVSHRGAAFRLLLDYLQDHAGYSLAGV
jgi:XTP/dITP diphosphohydrolase